MATLTISNASAEDLATLVQIITTMHALDTSNWSFSFGESASRFNERDVIEYPSDMLNEVAESIDRIIANDEPSDGDVLDEIGGSW